MTLATNIPQLDIDPYSESNLLNPYPMHEILREAGPVVWLSPYQIYACARHQEVHAVLNDWETFISGAGVGLTNFNLEEPFRPKSLILEQDPPFHTQTRAILSRILSPKTVLRALIGCVVGAVVYRLAIALALNADFMGLKAQDLNLITAILVTLAIVLPGVRRSVQLRRGKP